MVPPVSNSLLSLCDQRTHMQRVKEAYETLSTGELILSSLET
jgi:hypothetical protein